MWRSSVHMVRISTAPNYCIFLRDSSPRQVDLGEHEEERG